MRNANVLQTQLYNKSTCKTNSTTKAGEITYKDALKHADSPNDLRLTIKLSEEGSDQLLNASKNITFDGQ